MTRDELMELAAEKAVAELSWDSIEFLFRPSNILELLLRLDFEGMKEKIIDWTVDDAPGAMPWRFRPPYVEQLNRAIEIERFYRALKELHDA